MKKSIRVDMPAFLITVLEDDKEVKQISRCAFGRPGHLTPIVHDGALSMTKRDVLHHSTIYNNAVMPFALFFEQDPTCAFHEGNVEVASHGCVHLGHDDAKWLFEWAAKDPVSLHMSGPYPAVPIKA